MDSFWQAAFLGGFFGVFNGFFCRLALKKNIDKSNKVFFAIFVSTFFYKLIFLIGSILILNFKKSIILISYAGFLIAFQMIFELIPVKK